MIMELKPCPFCGSEPKYFDHSEHNDDEWHEVACTNHECTYLIAQKSTKESAFTAWNTRCIPKGFTIVPVEPTDEMIQAGLRADNDSFPLQYIYKAMIDSAKELD